MIRSLSSDSWECTWQSGGVGVKLDTKNLGQYDLLQEPYCGRCSRPEVTEENCGFHWFLDEALHRIYAPGKYYTTLNFRTNDLTRHVLALKKDQKYAIPIALALSLTLHNRYRELLDVHFIVPVPLHPDKRTKRGFDQAEEIGQKLASLLSKTFISPLVKTRNVSIHSIPRLMDKLEAVKGLYSCTGDYDGKQLLLVDDIATSGLDLAACAKALKESGAFKVDALVAGRTVFRY